MSLLDDAAKADTHSSTPHPCHWQAHGSCTPPQSTPGPDRGPVIAVIIFSLLISFVAVLLYCLLKPISDLVSGAGHGFGAAMVTMGSGMVLFLNSMWGSFASHASSTVSYIQCEYLHTCPSTLSAQFHDECFEGLYNRTVSMAAFLKLEAQDTIHIKLYLTNISNGLVFDVVTAQIDVFGQLSRDAGYDRKLSSEIRPELTKRFEHERDGFEKFMSLLYVVNKARYDALKTFEEQLASLEKPIKHMWYFPSSSSYEMVQAQMEGFCKEVDIVVFHLHMEVIKASQLLQTVNIDLNDITRYLSDASNSLSSQKSIITPYLLALGLSGTLDHNIAKLGDFALQVELASNDLFALYNLLKKMGRSSEKLKKFMDTTLPTIMEEDTNLLAVLNKFKDFQRLLV
ncbi:hypothetical protein EDD18DRAFT_1107328 [Armillaria luteobubalina]|uniref:Uncharacterized protein n=1 Tax=Armillaria luteobubalina TaxID=153913 RepID=A0AA39Q131_9AGAR|nr:hypothetical protein EDD18DRAFT_1107328 [Armillaria luteobubalina]